MNQQLINQIGTIVESACAAEANIFGYTIWTHHITRVAELGKQLAPHFHADPEIVVLGALLHDYASVKDASNYEDHHTLGALEAEKILQQFSCPSDRIEAVKHAIIAHRASVKVERRSPEAECLANADALAHILNIPSLLHLAFVNHGMDIDEGAEWVRAKITRSWNKLHPAIQTQVHEHYESALTVLTGIDHLP